ncbi:hypothetical protein O4328_35160 [Rhodococcus opacus]|uniref:Tetracycline repressor TetR C-terminal domain-containing protein n=1 Tax=Rhodococcus opacus TaxID=37919 RepID=A0AAX3YQV8_RHOOP|nr:hypothetical protein [Rhodococcus opacus]MCZ4588830.1 hypothetical protein [Rhodococcus opacus]WLF51867.1 hypothetical protein Q5707_41070 [Rhodococcus opacus]WLF52336.1 hypothetical protein Q5707_43925 [Rhodococcus opacus]
MAAPEAVPQTCRGKESGVFRSRNRSEPEIKSRGEDALLLDGLAHTFALLTGPANRPAAPPAWLLEAAAARYPRLAQELDRDWTDIEEEFIKAVTTVLRGAEPMSDGGCPGDAKGA